MKEKENLKARIRKLARIFSGFLMANVCTYAVGFFLLAIVTGSCVVNSQAIGSLSPFDLAVAIGSIIVFAIGAFWLPFTFPLPFLLPLVGLLDGKYLVFAIVGAGIHLMVFIPFLILALKIYQLENFLRSKFKTRTYYLTDPRDITGTALKEVVFAEDLTIQPYPAFLHCVITKYHEYKQSRTVTKKAF